MQRRSTLRSLRQETAILPYLANDPYIGLYTTFYLDMLFTNILLILDCGKQIMVDRASISIGMKGRYNLCCSRPITAVQPQPNHSRPTTAVQPQPALSFWTTPPLSPFTRSWDSVVKEYSWTTSYRDLSLSSSSPCIVARVQGLDR